MAAPERRALVVGAGPAGAVAARTLALAGARVTLLDRARFPRNKPCGGAISVRALQRFPWLAPALRSIATHWVSQLHLEGPDGHSTRITSATPPVVLIRRYEFDRLLVDLAVDAGAELVTGADIVQAEETPGEVVVTARDGRTFAAPVVIAADGVNSTVARRLGLNPGWNATRVAVDMMEETPRSMLHDVDPATMWVAYGFNPGGSVAVKGLRAPEGYAYVFPKRDHVNVGVGYVLEYFRGSVGEAPYELQLGFIDRLRRRGVVEGESSRAHFTPYLIPVGGPLARPGRGRVLLAGDAGGFVNGLTAEGIYYAMLTGELAAMTIVETRDADVPSRLARRYTGRCRGEVGTELRDSVLLQRSLFADRRRIAALVEGAAEARDLTDLFLAYVKGECDYRTVRRAFVRRVPGVALRLGWDRLRSLILPEAGAHGRI